jgi:hypothetical protein
VIALFAEGSKRHIEMINAHPDRFGSILTPTNNRAYLPKCAGVIGVDNGCFKGFKEGAFWSLLDFCEGYRERIKFVAAPDVVADSDATFNLFSKWQPIIRDYQLPVALVLQDGLSVDSIPWSEVQAIFVGGSTEYKMSRVVDRIIIEAKRRRKWVHVGRVSTRKRINHFRDVEVDSIDSVAFSRWPRHINDFARWTQQDRLFVGQTG